MVPLQIREYLTTHGNSPYRQWLKQLEITTQARIQARVFRFEQGNLGDVKPLGNGLWEARFSFGAGYRLYFGKDGDRIILLLMGGDKGSQKRDIQQARKFWTDYLEATNESTK